MESCDRCNIKLCECFRLKGSGLKKPFHTTLRRHNNDHCSLLFLVVYALKNYLLPFLEKPCFRSASKARLLFRNWYINSVNHIQLKRPANFESFSFHCAYYVPESSLENTYDALLCFNIFDELYSLQKATDEL